MLAVCSGPWPPTSARSPSLRKVLALGPIPTCVRYSSLPSQFTFTVERRTLALSSLLLSIIRFHAQSVKMSALKRRGTGK